MVRRVIIIHGSFGSAQENWFPWLANEVKKRGAVAIIPEFPTPERQTLKNWFAVFDNKVGELDRNTILVGHSLGAAFILRALERTKEPVGATFLVSGFLGKLGLPEFDAVNAEFVTAPVDWRQVRKKAGHVSVINSDSDPYVPIAKGQELADGLGVTLTVLHNAGHINTAAGYQQFPQLLLEIERLW
jgi:predicted alpha/beta hydrolase family esterase